MAKHQPLDFAVFVEAVSPATLQRYFSSLSTDNAPSGWAALNGEELERHLALPENGELDGLIRQDFRRLNDLSSYAPSLVVDAYARYSLPLNYSLSPQELALMLFLDHEEAWDFAWSRYLLMALDTKVSLFEFQAQELGFGAERIDEFKERVSSIFKSQAKGTQCEVRTFDFNGQRIVYIERGSYIRSITYWEGQEVQIKCYRPALEDVIFYEAASGDLIVKASLQNEREDYVRLFAHCFAGDLQLGEQALQSKTFSLAPVVSGSFNYQGQGQILGVDLVGIRLKLPFQERGTLSLNSQNIFATLRHMPDIRLDLGELTGARFRFKINDNNRARTMTFEVAPPARTDLPESKYTGIINTYLKNQGVRLR